MVLSNLRKEHERAQQQAADEIQNAHSEAEKLKVRTVRYQFRAVESYIYV